MDQHDGDHEGGAVYYRGVTVYDSRIFAQIQVEGVQTRLGYFKTREDAAKAYDEAATRMCARPVLNFTPDGTLNEHRYADTEEEAYEAYCQVKEMWTRYRIDEMLDSLKDRNDGEVMLRAMMRGADRTTRLKPTIESHCQALKDLLGIAIQSGVVQ